MLTATQVIQITDSLAQSIADVSTCFMTNTATSSPSSSTILAGLSSTTIGRILALNDTIPEINLLPAMNTLVQQMTAFLGGIQTLSSIYPLYYPFFDQLDRTCVYNGTTGLNVFLTGFGLKINGWFATAFNYWCGLAPLVTPGRSSANAPIKISAGNAFPSAPVDSLFLFTTGAGATIASSGSGTNASTTPFGGGVGQVTIYKANAGNAAGGATFTITYVNGAGVNVTATYNTLAGTPTGTLATGYAVSTALASDIIAVTGTGMTAGESYILGVVPPRSLSGY